MPSHLSTKQVKLKTGAKDINVRFKLGDARCTVLALVFSFYFFSSAEWLNGSQLSYS
jgi:hypothetical protein